MLWLNSSVSTKNRPCFAKIGPDYSTKLTEVKPIVRIRTNALARERNWGNPTGWLTPWGCPTPRQPDSAIIAQSNLLGENNVRESSCGDRGNRGIGLAISRQLAERGLRVLMTGRNAETGEAAAAALREQGHDVAFFAAEITDSQALRGWSNISPTISAGSISWSTTLVFLSTEDLRLAPLRWAWCDRPWR